MTNFELEGNTLGKKHQSYNKILQDAIKHNNAVKINDFDVDNDEVANLINIDIASHNKDAQYILKILTCEDMLYVTRAVKQSSWLIKDEAYAHIINPQYLRTILFPQMCVKGILKLLKHIKNHLCDEERAKEFYFSENNPKEAVKWLPLCSVELICNELPCHVQNIKMTLLRRLCEKSILVLEVYIKHAKEHEKRKALQETMFLLATHTNKYLDIVETMSNHQFPNFNQKATGVLMKNSKDRIINKFENYYLSIHLPTFIEHLKRENIKEFLLTYAQKFKPIRYPRMYFTSERLMLFIKLMPQDLRFDFVKLVFIDKIYETDKHIPLSENEREGVKLLCEITSHLCFSEHIWYQFAPFDTTLQKVKELFGTASSTAQKESLLEVLYTSARNNEIHERIFLEYLNEKLSNIGSSVTENLLKKLLSSRKFIKYDQNTWNVLDDILKKIDIYIEAENQHSLIIEAIILHKVTNGEIVPDIIERKFKFNSMVSYCKMLNEKDRETLFMYLFGIIMDELFKCNVTNETEFIVKIGILEKALRLIKDYKKQLVDYPALIYKIKDLVKIKKNFSWSASMMVLFNIEKTWRKLFFEDSLVISPNESAVFNALKHSSSYLENNLDTIQLILYKDTKFLRHNIMGKIKIYWPNSLAKHISLTYIEKLNRQEGLKEITRGLSILLSRKQLHDLIQKYAPKKAKVDWTNVDVIELSVQQQFAKNMHVARPQPSPETIIWFAKGDYLQYALPSLLSIFYNLSDVNSRKYIPTLLDAPVSLQKHGIRLAVSKIDLKNLLDNFSNIWIRNKNASIRAVMFKNVFNLMCKEKDAKKIKTIWELMEMFLNNLHFTEDKAIYKQLFKVKDVPLDVRGVYYMKVYDFLTKLIKSGDEYECYKYDFNSEFAKYSTEIVEHLDANFIENIVKEFIDNEFMKGQVPQSRECIIDLILLHLLIAKNEEIQLERFKTILLPILRECFSLWNLINEDQYFIRNNLVALLNCLRYNVKNKGVLPKKIFSLIQEELEGSLTIPEDYMLLTKWKLTTTLIALLNEQEPNLDWDEACKKVAVNFGDKCNNYLKEDCNKYFPRIYLLFIKALKSMLNDFVSNDAHLDIYKCLMHREDFMQGYLGAIRLYADEYRGDDEFQEIWENISHHPAAEIRIHFFSNKRIKNVTRKFQ